MFREGFSMYFYSCDATSHAAMPAWIFGDCREGEIPRSLLRWNFDAPSACCGVFDFVIGCYIFCVMKWTEGGSDSSGPIYMFHVFCSVRKIPGQIATKFGLLCNYVVE